MNSKFKVAAIVAVMVASAFVFLPAFAVNPNSNLTYTPGIYSSGSSTLAAVSGGNFGAGTTVYFYLSSDKLSTGIMGSYIGSYTLPAGSVSLYYSHVILSIPTVPQGSYYIIASNSASPTSTSAEFFGAFSIYVTSLRPTFSVTGSQSMTAAGITGTGWDPSSTVDLYLAGNDGTPLFSDPVGSFQTTDSGQVAQGSQFIIPSTSEGTYTLIADEVSSSSPNYGITADYQMTITPYISVSPYDISGQQGTTFTIYGYGFPPYASVQQNSVKVDGQSLSNAAVTSSQYGSFSVSAELLSTITSSGPQSVSIGYNTSTYTQQDAVFISSPNVLNPGFSFTVISSNVYPGSPFKAYVYNFPSSVPVTISIGDAYIGTVNTDTNGFGAISGFLPDVPSGNYYVTAYYSGIVSSVNLNVQSYYEVLDPSGVPMISDNEYFPSGGIYTVEAFGLEPQQTYKLLDSGASFAMGSAVTSVTSGKIVSGTQSTFLPAYNGTLIFRFKSYFPSDISTSTITLSGVSGYGSETFGYTAYHNATFSISQGSVSIMEQGSTETLTVSNLIPYGSLTYPGLDYTYLLYLDGNELTFTVGSSSVQTQIISSTTSSTSVTFSVPDLSNGVYNFGIKFEGASYYVNTVPVVISTPSGSINSGSIATVPIYSNGQVSGYYVVGFGFYELSSLKIYYYTQQGVNSASLSDTDGGFSFNGISTIPSEESGNYAIYVDSSYGTGNYVTGTTYTAYPSFKINSNSGGIGSVVSYTLSDSSSNAPYTLMFGGHNVLSSVTNENGFADGTFNVPVVQAGTYKVSVSSSSFNYSLNFTVTASTTLTLNIENYAFPGQLVNYTWTASSLPDMPGPFQSEYYGPIWTTVYLNNSAYSTVSSQIVNGAIQGSFMMPNGNPGNYYLLTLSWTQNVYSTVVSGSGSGAVDYSLVTVNSHQMAQGNGQFIKIISGNGAIVTGISQSQIAEITSSVNASISSSMQVPLSELNASISSINNAVVTINTAFGKMETTLNAINSSIVSINNGMANIETSLGNVQVSLKNINASVIGANNGIISLETSAGAIKTSLNNLQPEISFMNGTVMKISTVAGMINYNITQFSSMEISSINGMNATVTGMIGGMNVTMLSSFNSLDTNIVSVNGNEVKIETTLGTINGNITGISNGVATIQTDLGTMRTNVSAIQGNIHSNSNVSSNIYLLIIVIVILVIITLIVALVAMMGVRDIAKRFGMKKE